MGPERTPSDLDAMGQDKRRQVVGGRYGISPRKRLVFYGAFLAAAILLIVAFLTVVRAVDDREIGPQPSAPWTSAADQQPTRPVDFPANGPKNTIEAEQIGEAVPPSAVITEPG